MWQSWNGEARAEVEGIEFVYANTFKGQISYYRKRPSEGRMHGLVALERGPAVVCWGWGVVYNMSPGDSEGTFTKTGDSETRRGLI